MIWLRNKFLAGLALVVPLVVTFWILRFVYEFLLGMSTPLLISMGSIYNQTVGPALQIDLTGETFLMLTRFVGFLVPVVVLVALGVMATNVLGVRVVSAMDKLLLRIPMISFIYKSLKQVIEAFRGFGDTRNFKRVVYVEYPSPGMKLVGFVTGQFMDEKTQKSMTMVFVPGALSPMTGLLIVAETHTLIDAPLTLEEAMKMVFSGGLIGPDSANAPLVRPVPKRVKGRKRGDEFAGLPQAEDYVEPEEVDETGMKGEERELAGAAAPQEKSSFLPWRKK
ncbi:DUF502 domain-containing protein [Phragmitibacter flavus]|uniref:DUF502 domain-containing protein n=1 Tax=Phragmitibacter flavus TaxID=2576071 RepID=UPI00140CA1E8|nr:DUF502 domain-containing protein [Phragmitibacter flavus]